MHSDEIKRHNYRIASSACLIKPFYFSTVDNNTLLIGHFE